MNAPDKTIDLSFLAQDLQLFITEAQQASSRNSPVQHYVDRLKEILMAHLKRA
ncbi:MAG: hypothetical protein K0R28_52 [Paenibacillus sp.]|jgi:hypothetical protein|nr:hypothetical protein [Paenibacillus sp.]